MKNYLCQADPSRDLVGDVLPIDVSYPGARDVLHATTTHPHLRRHREAEERAPSSESSLLYLEAVSILKIQRVEKVKEDEGRR